jgi:hypothetical protein
VSFPRAFSKASTSFLRYFPGFPSFFQSFLKDTRFYQKLALPPPPTPASKALAEELVPTGR